MCLKFFVFKIILLRKLIIKKTNMKVRQMIYFFKLKSYTWIKLLHFNLIFILNNLIYIYDSGVE